MTKKPKTQIEIVNKLVKMSFGKGFSGNCILFSNNSRNVMVKADKLESIAKRKFPYIPRLIENYEVAGEFTSEDGSSLKVRAEYKNSTQRYADYYKLHFKKDVSVEPK